MSNTSATGGILTPNISPKPLENGALLDFLQIWFVGLTGLPGQMVRPRWQPEPPNIPPAGTDWMAFGIPRREADTFVAEVHQDGPPWYNELRRHEILHILTSFYGPSADTYAELLRENMQVAQNLEYLKPQSMGLIESGDAITVPEFVKNQWYYRVDLMIQIRRQIVRGYQVQNIESAEVGFVAQVSGQLDNGVYTENLEIKEH